MAEDSSSISYKGPVLLFGKGVKTHCSMQELNRFWEEAARLAVRSPLGLREFFRVDLLPPLFEQGRIYLVERLDTGDLDTTQTRDMDQVLPKVVKKLYKILPCRDTAEKRDNIFREGFAAETAQVMDADESSLLMGYFDPMVDGGSPSA